MLRGWVALTGTPGVGKSTVANVLRLKGVPNVNLGAFAQDNDLTDGFDEVRLSAVVDPARIARELARRTQNGQLLLLDGHWSHEVPGVESAIVLRLRPLELESRLRRRGWAEAKVRENLEAEGMDLVLQEAVARLGPRRVFEVDATPANAEQLAATLFQIVRGERSSRKAYAPGRVNWAEDVLAWY